MADPRKTDPSRRAGARGPVRLKVSYKSPEALLGEFTRSIGKGVVALESARKLPVGTQFIFELHVQGGGTAPVEVTGEVVQVTTAAKGKYLLAIRYDPTGERAGVDAVLRKIFDAHKTEKVRQYPRVPLQLRATEDSPYSPSYLVRDVSRGGVGMEVEAPSLPRQVKIGSPFLLELWISLGTLLLHGELVWAFNPPPDRSRWVNPSFGVTFGKLRQDTVDRLDRLLLLRGLPPPPWKARVSFGMDAVSRMP